MISDIIQDVAKAVTKTDFFQLPADDHQIQSVEGEPAKWHQTILRM